MAGEPRALRELLDILNDDLGSTEAEAAYHRAYFEQRMREQFLWDRRKKPPERKADTHA